MKLKVLTLIGAGLFALTACGSKAVNYIDFHAKASEAFEACKSVTYSKVTLNGSFKNDSSETKTFDNVVLRFKEGAYIPDNALHAEEDLAAIVMNLTFAVLEQEDENTKYYIGGFKTVYQKDDTKVTTEWNQYGLMTKVVSGDSKFTATYKK